MRERSLPEVVRGPYSGLHFGCTARKLMKRQQKIGFVLRKGELQSLIDVLSYSTSDRPLPLPTGPPSWVPRRFLICDL
jgi:hypothetical protein